MYGASTLACEELSYLVQHGARPYEGVFNPIMLAAQDGNYDMCLFLLQQSSDTVTLLKSIDNIGYQPLRHAVNFGFLGIAELFLNNGADINALDNHKESILGWAIRSVNNTSDNVMFCLAWGSAH